VGKRQALGWLGAALCSVALIVAGGLVLSSVAVNRYLQASSSAMHRGDVTDMGPTPAAAEMAGIDHVVAAVMAMPGVATASCTVDTPTAAAEPQESTPAPSAAPSPVASTTFNYDISVIMTPDATAAQSAEVVFSMTKQLQNSHVNVALSSPAGDGHAASVVDYRHAFDAPVSRSTVAAVSQAVAVAAAVPGVKSVRVSVPYTWNLASGDLDIDFDSPGDRDADQLKSALERTALKGLDWSTSR